MLQIIEITTKWTINTIQLFEKHVNNKKYISFSHKKKRKKVTKSSAIPGLQHKSYKVNK